MTTALILAGHGSHITSGTAGLIWKHVDTIRSMGIADEVTAAFWKEMPSFSTVLNSLSSNNITIVPLFTAKGYFTQTVIPTEMNLTGDITKIGERIIRYTRTLNEHPYLSQIVQQRIEDAIKQVNVPPNQIAVVIIGHSTRRNPESRKATEAEAAKIRTSGLVAEVQSVYLDDTPTIADLYILTSAPYVIAVPYFLTQGSHTTIDVPEELGLLPGVTLGEKHGRMVYYTDPVGIEATLIDTIIELANEAGTLLHEPRQGTSWSCFPAKGRETFTQFVHRQTELHGSELFGQLVFSGQEVRVKDLLDQLKQAISPSQLRQTIRENPFRSLTTSRDLPGKWYIRVDYPEMLHAIAETVYPGAVADWVAYQNGTFQTNTFESTISRQTGSYRELASLDKTEQGRIVNHICSNCIRHPIWFNQPASKNIIPCPEPCNHWLSAALEASI